MPKIFSETPFQLEYFFLSLLGISKQKQLLHYLLFFLFFFFAVICRWNCLHVSNCDSVFPQPKCPYYAATASSVRASISAIFCHLATKYDHKSLAYDNNKFPPAVIKCLLTEMKWKWWFYPGSLPINLAHLRLGSSAEKFKRRWSSCADLVHLPMDLPQLPANLCSLMDAIIPYVHSCEEARGRWQS